MDHKRCPECGGTKHAPRVNQFGNYECELICLCNSKMKQQISKLKANKIVAELEQIKNAIVSASKTIGEPSTENAIEICNSDCGDHHYFHIGHKDTKREEK